MSARNRWIRLCEEPLATSAGSPVPGSARCGIRPVRGSRRSRVPRSQRSTVAAYRGGRSVSCRRSEATATVESTGQDWPGYASRNGERDRSNARPSAAESSVKRRSSAGSRASSGCRASTPPRSQLVQPR
ncbi:hypothetical protein ACFQQB_52165 [Nonomuraea rubra]|uniref:hypothetical protein n=1 Tax=Nonomuraea rubra TaxID=46180 RepID=UPI003622B1F4